MHEEAARRQAVAGRVVAHLAAGWIKARDAGVRAQPQAAGSISLDGVDGVVPETVLHRVGEKGPAAVGATL